MSQQHTTQTSGQGMLERVFRLCKYGTTARAEVIAGFTTFLTMVHTVSVNPRILGVADMDTNAVFVTTYPIVVFGSIMMGLLANLLVAPAPTMGPNAFLAFVVVQTMGLPWQIGVSAIFWSAIGLLLPTISRVRYWMIANIPVSPRVGITSGIGLLIDIVGLKNVGVIVTDPETLVSIGSLTSHSVLPGILSFFIIAVLVSCSIHAAMLVSIVVTTLLGWVSGDVYYNGIASMPPSVMTITGHIDLAGSFNLGLARVIFSLMPVSLFNSSGTLIGVINRAGLVDEKGKFPHMKQALYVDSVSSVTGSSIGASSVTAYIESPSGVLVGSRTGLTAVVVGLLLLLVISLLPLARVMPGYAAAGALIYVGALMTSGLAYVNWQDLTESVPAPITAVMMPFSLSITEGIVLDFIPHCMMKIGTGRLCDPSSCVVIVTLILILKIVLIDAH